MYMLKINATSALNLCLLKDHFIVERGLLISSALAQEGEGRLILYFFKALILPGIMIIGKVLRERWDSENQMHYFNLHYSLQAQDGAWRRVEREQFLGTFRNLYNRIPLNATHRQLYAVLNLYHLLRKEFPSSYSAYTFHSLLWVIISLAFIFLCLLSGETCSSWRISMDAFSNS